MVQPATVVAEQPRSPMVEGFARFWANPDPTVLPPLLAEDVVGHFPGEPEPVRGRDAYVAKIAHFLQLLPDLRLEVAEHATNGELHFIRWIARTTGAKGPVQLTGIDRIRVHDGLVTENFVVFDTARFAALIGG
jgi:predicted SnoaL-like aldol condensation-catalyzing enzyme